MVPEIPAANPLRRTRHSHSLAVLLNSRACLLLLATVLLSSGAGAQEVDPPAKTPSESTASESTPQNEPGNEPGPEHRQLARLVGKWKADITSYWSGSDQPQSSQGTAQFRQILGGRFIRQRLEGTLAGQDFTGMGVLGYDQHKKQFVGTWIDNMSTSILVTEGHYDVETHTLIETGSSSTAEGVIAFKMTTRFESSDRFVFQMYRVESGKEDRELLRIAYSRDR